MLNGSVRKPCVAPGASKSKRTPRRSQSAVGSVSSPRRRMRERGEVTRKARDVDDVDRAEDAGGDDEVVDGLAVLVPAGLHALEGADDGAGIARVAVGVPAAHRGDLDGARQVPCPVAERHHGDAGIGDDVADAGVAVVAPVGGQHVAAGAPVVGIAPCGRRGRRWRRRRRSSCRGWSRGRRRGFRPSILRRRPGRSRRRRSGRR